MLSLFKFFCAKLGSVKKNRFSHEYVQKIAIGTSVGFGNAFPVNLSGHCFHRSTSSFFCSKVIAFLLEGKGLRF